MNKDSGQEHAKSGTLNQAVTSLIAALKETLHRIFRTLKKIKSAQMCIARATTLS